MRLPRYRLRTLMIAVAVVGVASWAVVERRRQIHLASIYLARAADHARAELTHSQMLRRFAEEEREALARAKTIGSKQPRSAGDRESLRQITEENNGLLDRIRARLAFHARLYDYHSRMRRKYDDASSRPWSSVAPDPPPPE